MEREGMRLHVGARFGRGVVLEIYPQAGTRVKRVRLMCDCGKEYFSRTPNLYSNRHLSCGCQRAENRIKHGYLAGPHKATYNRWYSMIKRCHDPKSQSYRLYGGRGITVCQEWRDSFEKFLEDMGDVPPGLTLDRIDTFGNYCKENCRWASHQTQGRNRRNNVRYSLGDKMMLLVEAAEQFNFCLGTLKARVRSGMTLEEALSKPIETKYKRRRYSHESGS